MKDFLIQDQMWCSSLDDTKWLLLVAQCLDASNTVAEHISNEKRRNIVIKGILTINSCHAEYVYVLHSSSVFILLTRSIPVVNMYFQS